MLTMSQKDLALLHDNVRVNAAQPLLRQEDRVQGGAGLGAALTALWNEVQRRAYRWRRLNGRLEERLKVLQDRVAQLDLSDVGIPISNLDPKLDRRVAPERAAGEHTEIGSFAQDGGLLSRFGPFDWAASITAEQFMPRTGCRLTLLDVNGRLGVRKEFGSARGRFVQELEGLIDLREQDCAVPGVMGVDWDKQSIILEYVPGAVLREALAVAGAALRQRELEAAGDRTPYRDRIKAAQALLPSVVSNAQIARIGEELHGIHSAGYVLEDVKYGNIIIHALTGEPVFIDFERALPLPGNSRGLSEYLRGIDLGKFFEHFGRDAY